MLSISLNLSRGTNSSHVATGARLRQRWSARSASQRPCSVQNTLQDGIEIFIDTEVDLAQSGETIPVGVQWGSEAYVDGDFTRT